jgi:peptidoglycan/xylan/chitin deacetylase (PgdA/CDA1 family)
VISFDDGYADNLEQAKPWLEAYEIPATVFVAAGQVGQQEEFWWDELDRLLLQPGTLPSTLRLGLNGNVREWDLGGASQYSVADYWRDRDWNIEREDTPTMRQHLFRELFDWLYGMPETDKQRLLDDLRQWAGLGQAGRTTHRTLTADEMVRLSEGGLVAIGAHTMTHPLLSELQVEEQRSEIRQSKEHLEAILKKPVMSFALPHGARTAETLSILAETGFDCVCTSEADAVWAGADRFQLPRLGVRDWDKETFTRWLRWWMDG